MSRISAEAFWAPFVAAERQHLHVRTMQMTTCRPGAPAKGLSFKRCSASGSMSERHWINCILFWLCKSLSLLDRFPQVLCDVTAMSHLLI